MEKALIIDGLGQTHVGRVRSSNQDSFLAERQQQLYIVADGMGGHAGGEIASRMCVDLVAQKISARLEEERVHKDWVHPDARINAILSESINAASARIYEHALEEPSLRGMGTTATVLQFVDHRAYVGHVGDSRLYLVRGGFIYQLTFDHSLVNEQVRAGIITPEEAEQHHLKNVITRSVGYLEEEDVDTFSIDIVPGDIFILCSDGLHGKVSDKDLAKMTTTMRLEAVDKFINLANEKGGEDNITVVMVAVDEPKN